MKTNREIRKEAHKIVFSHWLGRLLTVGITLLAISQLAEYFMRRMIVASGVKTWQGFLEENAAVIRSGAGMELPPLAVMNEMTGAATFEMFIAYVFGSIMIFGFIATSLKSMRDDSNRWFADSLGGFRRPLELAWLMLLTNIRVFLWTLLFIIPGFVAMYRYRAAWYLKTEHPDWSAWKCLDESGRMMRGYKWQAFALDLSFLGWLLLAVLVTAVATALASSSMWLQSLIGSFLSLGGLVLVVLVMMYMFTGRTVFYTELKRIYSERENDNVQP